MDLDAGAKGLPRDLILVGNDVEQVGEDEGLIHLGWDLRHLD